MYLYLGGYVLSGHCSRQKFQKEVKGTFSDGYLFTYTLNSEPKALTGDKSEGIKSQGVAEAFI